MTSDELLKELLKKEPKMVVHFGLKEKGKVYSIVLPLSPAEWCALCMRDGESYQGACCGNTSAIQDVLNNIFRNSGVAYNHDIEKLVRMSQTHEGFESWTPEFGMEAAAALLKDWKNLDPIDKIGLSIQAVYPRLESNLFTLAGTPPKEERDFVNDLSKALHLIALRDLFDKESKSHGGRHVLLARAVPAARRFLEIVKEKYTKPVECYAVVEKGTREIQVNQLGYMLYRTAKEARKAVEAQQKWAEGDDEEQKRLSSLEVKKVFVSVEKGFEWP